MDVIANNRIEGIDWVQAQLTTMARPTAEKTYFGLIDRGLLIEGEGQGVVSMPNILGQGEVINVAREEAIRRDNKSRSQMTKRRHSPTIHKRQKTSIHQGNMIDCAEDDIYR